MNTEPQNNDKVMGIQKDKYLKITYALLLISSVAGILGGLVGAVAGLASLLGLAGLVLALLGLFVFKAQFNEQQNSHFKYMGFLFLVFFVIGIVFSTVLGGLGIITILLIIAINLASLLLMFVGYRLNEKGEVAIKDNVINELKSLKP